MLNELVNGESGVVRLNNGVGHLRRGNDGESGHHTVGELLTDLGDEEGTHTGTSAATKRVGDLEACKDNQRMSSAWRVTSQSRSHLRNLLTLETVSALSLLADDIKDRVDELSSLGVI